MNEPTPKQREHFEQQFVSQVNDFHHIIPTSRGGGNNGDNKVRVNMEIHQKYHRLFTNRTPPEILHFLIEYFWGGDMSFVDIYLKERGYKPLERTKADG